ncbi:RNase P/MRP, p29 subunit [Periconia macrospinosa]|uniref:Ribonuclease P protein subunit n=1 Tax=Periconia macrospinosa TaxID=97972 RepID=A0A2V1E1N8_9PLEO|nr:RNase P/MRP, p29 subunit [Periconia macrospinosa]
MSAAPTPPFVQTLLARAHSPKTAESHYTERVSKRPLHIRATSPTPSARAQRRRTLNTRLEKQRARTKLKPRPLSAARKRALGLNEIAKNQQKYSIYQGLHELWCGYMREILGVSAGKRAYVTAAQVGQMLASADMHGALVEVTRSRCVSRVGIKGIVVRDTKYTFEIITEKNKLKVVPKEHSMFRFEVPVLDPGEEDGRNKEDETDPNGSKPLVFEVLGEQIQVRGSERANRKFRLHYQPDI